MILPLAYLNYPKIDPIIFSLGPLKVRWYGVAYLAGFILGYCALLAMARRKIFRIAPELIGDLIGWLALGVVIGGRAGWWIFYHHNIHEPEPWYQPVALWTGGMSFHGGLIGVILVLFIWSRVEKASFLNLADCLALVTPIGLCLGRIANFINGELVGRPSNLPWAVLFPDYPQPRHPSQIYEALLEGPVLAGAVWLVRSIRSRRDGEVAASFVTFYGLLRLLVEFTREPDVQLGFIFAHVPGLAWMTMGQLLSIAIMIVGLVWWIILRRRPQSMPDISDALPSKPESGKSQSGKSPAKA